MTWRGRWCCGAAPNTPAAAGAPTTCWPPSARVGVASGLRGRRSRRRRCCVVVAAGRSSHPRTLAPILTLKRQPKERWSVMPVPNTVGAPARIGAGALLAALGEDLEPGRAAEVYAALRYPVLPVFEPNPGGCACRDGAGCDRAGKHPRIAGGVWQATTDPAVVRRWWRRWPAANLALRTGVRFDVADVDGQPGVEALRALLTNADRPLGCGPLARSGGGGWHLLFAPTGSG